MRGSGGRYFSARLEPPKLLPETLSPLSPGSRLEAAALGSKGSRVKAASAESQQPSPQLCCVSPLQGPFSAALLQQAAGSAASSAGSVAVTVAANRQGEQSGLRFQLYHRHLDFHLPAHQQQANYWPEVLSVRQVPRTQKGSSSLLHYLL